MTTPFPNYLSNVSTHCAQYSCSKPLTHEKVDIQAMEQDVEDNESFFMAETGDESEDENNSSKQKKDSENLSYTSLCEGEHNQRN